MSSDRRLISVVSLAQAGAQLGSFAVPALLPAFIADWRLSATEAGWLAGAFYLGYTLSVPVLASLTDRVDPRAIYLGSVALTCAALAGLATIADGLWSGLACRLLHGVGWAGCYMPGLKILGDRLSGPAQSRAVAAHAASVGISGACSFLAAGLLGAWLGWRAAMVAGALAALGSLLLMLLLVAPKAPPPAAAHRALLDFRPVLRNRSAMAYAIGYGVHTWEMSVLRSWVVPFLAYAGAGSAMAAVLPPAVVATAMAFLGVWASVLGNEASIRLGRRRTIVAAMLAAVATAAVFGLAGELGYLGAVAAVLAYAALIWGDSSSLTAGASGSARPGERGATLAVHSTLGYFGGFAGPVVLGAVLDLAGGPGPLGWWLGFAHVAVVVALGLGAFLLLRPAPLADDRA